MAAAATFGANFQHIKFQVFAYDTPVQKTAPKVARITLNRPERGNAITALMASELTDCFRYIEAKRTEIRVLVLTGAGRYFCTGMDLQQASSPSGDGGNEIITGHNSTQPQQDPTVKFQEMFNALCQLSIPTLCQLNGPALGGGVGLFFCCDIRYSTNVDNYLCLAECKRGLVPALISPYIVAEVGKSVAMEMMMGGGRLTSKRMYKLGLVSAVIGCDDFPALTLLYHEGKQLHNPSFQSADEAERYYLDSLVSSAPKATGMIKELVRRVGFENADWQGRLEHVRSLFPQMMANDEAAIGMISFLSKQTPDWQQSKL